MNALPLLIALLFASTPQKKPTLAPAPGADFHLSAGSPAIGRAICDPANPFDADNVPRPNRPPNTYFPGDTGCDVGAYQYVPRITLAEDTSAPSVILSYPGGPIVIVWEPSTETLLAGYCVYRADLPGGYTVPLNVNLVPIPMYSDATALIGRTYYYTVKAVLKDGSESAASSEIVAKR